MPSSLISKKPSWDGYVGDATKYTITKEEALRRQKERVSKHNVLLSEVTPTKTRTNIKRIKIKQNNNDIKKPSSSSSSLRKYKHKEMNSLDLVNNKEVDTMTNITTFMTEIASGDDADADTSINTTKKYHVSFSNIDESDKENDCTVDLKMNTMSDINDTIDNTIAYDNSSIKVQKGKKPVSTTSSSPKKADQLRTRNRSMNLSNSFKMSPMKFKNSSSRLQGVDSESHSDELEDIVQQIRSLNGELRYYEQLSGRRSVFDAEELEVALEAMLDENSAKVSSVSVMRYLVQLVCQSMSYLLQSQIDIVERDAKFESLTEKVNLLTRIVLPSDENKPLKKKNDPQTPSNNNTYEVKTPTHSKANGSYISPVTPSSSSSTAISSPEIAFNMSIAATPLTTKAGSDIIERSKMNGSSPTDWLFASSHLSINKNSESPLRLFTTGSQFAIPPTTNLVDDSYKLAETIIGHEENDGKFDEISTNLMSKFMSSSASPSKDDVINFTDAMNSQSIEESRMRELYTYLAERGILNSPSRVSNENLPSPADAPSKMPPVPESVPIHPFKKVYDARIGHYDAV